MPRKIISSFVVRRSSFVKGLFLCLLSAVLLALSFSNPNFEFMAWFGFIPLFFAIQGKSKIKAFLLAYFTGFLFWLGIIYWLAHVTLAGMFILAFYLALYFGIFGLFFKSYELQVTSYELLVIPAVWVLLEYLRSHLFTGFPWALLGYAQYLNLPLIQIADITGVWGVSFLVMMVNAAVYRAISRKLSAVSKKQNYLLPISLLFVTIVYGYFKIYYLQLKAYSLPLKVSVVQGNILQELKWNPQSREDIINKYLDISWQALRDNPDLIIWPEAALPVVLEEEPLFFKKVNDFVKQVNTPLLLGAVTRKENSYYNSALLVSGKGDLLNKYDKLHLVPFGEYIPLRKTLCFLETVVPIGDFTAGIHATVFSLPVSYQLRSVKFSVLICFEDLFYGIARDFRKKGADFLVNITNDAWFKDTAAPYQHLCASVFRAVENRVFLLRAANTGVSAFIAPNGKIISRVSDKFGKGTFVDGYKTEQITVPREPLSFYSRYSYIFIGFCFLSALYGVLLTLRKSEEKSCKL